MFTNIEIFWMLCLLSFLLLGFEKNLFFILESYLDASIVFQSVKTAVKY